ncbi:MAG: 16S rRNA (guanine(966)-N(2))-methyltransferase RsmD [Bacilli bacterium]
MRVISGFLKGRNIKGDKIKGTRPTMDKIKQSVFAMIQDDVRESTCLDLFAGSGSLGIEAISNGASSTYFIDKGKEAYDTIKYNIEQFNIENQSKVFHDDYMKMLLYFKNNNIQFNLIFLDPPYKENLIEEVLTFISNNNLLYPYGQVICEFSDEILDDEYGNLSVIKQRLYGDKQVKIYINRNV